MSSNRKSVAVRPSTIPFIGLLIKLTFFGAMFQFARALVTRPAFHRQLTPIRRNPPSALFSSTQKDEYGRTIRRKPESRDASGGDGGWDDFDGGWDDLDSPAPSKPAPRRGGSSSRSSGGWDDEDTNDYGGGWDNEDRPQRRSSGGRENNRGGGRGGRGGNHGERSGNNYRGNRNDNRGGGRNEYGRGSDRRGGGRSDFGRGNDRRDDFGRGPDKRNKGKEAPKVRQINMNALEGAGFIHLYGLSSVLNALEAGRRDFSSPEEDLFPNLDGGEVESNGFDDEGNPLPERKPEAQFKPWLFVQSKTAAARSDRSASKANAAAQVEALAKREGVPIAEVDKGILNSLSGNRPHQGYVLRCGKLSFEPISSIPHPSEDPSSPSLWLVLDEVVDPQNLGALLRSAYFLGGDKVGILVCSKNSAPPSPVVSAASAGALEVANIYSTSNLPRTLNSAQEAGFRIIGASSSVPSSSNELFALQDLPAPGQDGDDRPVLVVLGSEGHGLRTLVAKACTEFVTLPSGLAGVDGDDDSSAGVDSLNVSVTGGILLWHMLHGK